MNNIYKIAASILLLCMLILTGCTTLSTPQSTKIVLLAPFEGRYSEVGYEALYAARLALSESQLDLTPIDDGGSVDSAVDRARAIARDSEAGIVLATGPFSTTESVQEALEPLSVIIVGGWNTTPSRDEIYILSHKEIPETISTQQSDTLFNIVESELPILSDERLALSQLPALYDNLENISIVSSASLPTEEFTERYLNSAEFASPPVLLASLAYDAATIAQQHIETGQPINNLQYEGLNGQFQFTDGYWQQAPIFTYRYQNGELVLTAD